MTRVELIKYDISLFEFMVSNNEFTISELEANNKYLIDLISKLNDELIKLSTNNNEK